jgi:hypothetical protein
VREVPTWYAQSRIELAYATTVYGAQGETTNAGRLVVGESTSAASAYVGMTRGRHDNVAHIVAEDRDQARAIWEQAFSRDRADLGVAHARLQAIDDIDRYGPNGPAHVRAQAAAKQRTLQERQGANRHEFERWRTETPEPTRRSRSGPGIGF